MKAKGRFIETNEGSYTAKATGEVVKQLDVMVLTDETELVVVRASGDYIPALVKALTGVKSMDPIELACDGMREFGGRQVWRFHA
jgi:hypothetical protein